MNRREWWFVQLASMVLVVAFGGVATGAGSGETHASAARSRGCHDWAPVFRPVLSTLSVGKILVALPAHVPRFGQRVYAHANVLMPPLTYDVVLSTQPGSGWPVPRRTTLLTIHGTAGSGTRPRGSSTRVVDGKALTLRAKVSPMRVVVWWDRAANITYSAGLPARLGLPTLFRIAGSLTPGVLRRSPITDGTPVPFNPCP